MTDKGFGLWGPKVDKQSVPTEAPTTDKTAVVSMEEDQGANVVVPEAPVVAVQEKPRKQWGLWDVVNGFLLMIGFQLIFAVVIIVYVTFKAVQSGVGADDADAIIAQVLEVVTTGPALFFSSLSMYAAWLIIAWHASYKKGARSFKKDFKLAFNLKRDLLYGVIFAASLQAFVLGTSWLLEQLGVDLSTGGNTDIITSQQGIWFFLNAVLVASFLAPFFEELFFRGLFLQAALKNFTAGQTSTPHSLLGRVVSDRTPKVYEGFASFRRFLYRGRNVFAILLTGTVFGFMHFQGADTFAQWLVVIQAGIIGAFLAFVTLKTGRLGPAIITHIVFNGSSVVLATLLAGS